MSLPRGVRRLFRLGRVRRDVDDEIDHHLAEAVRELMRRGWSEEDAQVRARERFGDERAYRKALETIDHGSVRMRERSETVDVMMRTVGQSIRGLKRNPGFAVSLIVILALGIGANAVMFGVVDRLLLSPPQHIVDADDVRLIYVQREIFNGETIYARSLTHPDYEDLLEAASFESVAGYTTPREETVGRGDAATQMRVAGASATLFPLLGVRPAMGRFFDDSEDGPGANPTAVLAHEFWEREYGADEGVVGRGIDVGEGVYTVIGVAPPGFTGPQLEPIDIWLPLETAATIENGEEWIGHRGYYWMQVVARLAPGAAVEAAEAEATALHRAGRTEQIEQGRYDAEANVVVAPVIAARGPSPTSEAQVARWLAGVSLVVLLIACFNAANLLLTRALRAQREIAVRLALGVSRSRLAAELMTETLLLTGLGAAAALGLAYTLHGPVHQILLPNVAFSESALGSRLVTFTAAVAVGAGLLAGVLPALQATRAHVADALKSGGRGLAEGRSRARVGLLIGQAALSVVLLVGAGLFVRSLRSASELDLGFDAREVVVVVLEWNETLPSAERQAIYEEVVERVRRVPAVREAGLGYTIPFWSSITLGQPRVPGIDSIPRHHDGGPYVNKVGSGYFEAMGLAIVEGRPFTPSDDAEGAPAVTILSESMATAIWPEGGAVGRCMYFGPLDDAPCTEVVGIVENHNRQALVEADPHFLYFVNQSHPGFIGPPQAIMAGVDGDPAVVAALLRDEARAASSRVRFVDTRTLQERVEPQLRSWKLGASMFTAFGVLALVVAGWGLYSVLAFDVAARRRELGVRSALGAGVPRLVRLVLRRAMALVVTGTLIGLGIAWGGSRFVAPLLFEVSPTDPLVYATVAATVAVVAAMAGWLPAWRAGRVDPREALQAE